MPVTLRQAVWVEYKSWWSWRRAKAVIHIDKNIFGLEDELSPALEKVMYMPNPDIHAKWTLYISENSLV